MANRRSHKKSRGGCQQCKQMKIKCDEAHPICRGCIKRELGCTYSTAPRTPSKPALVGHISQGRIMPGHAADDLELVHHFTVWTYKTCDHGLMPSSWWQEVLPVMAFQHDHLLYALLAFTSLHVAYLRPADAKKYVDLAVDYRERTLTKLSSLLPNIEPEQADACFWSSTLVGMIALALPATSGYKDLSPKSVLLGLSTLWRGAGMVAKMSAAFTGVHSPSNLPSTLSSVPMIPQLKDVELGLYFEKLRECIMEESVFAANTKESYVKAVADMAEACSTLDAQGFAGGIQAWLPCLDLRVQDSIASDDIGAILVLLFYGVVLHKVKTIWYISNLGMKLVEELTPKIPLTYPKMVRLVNWAREKVCQ